MRAIRFRILLRGLSLAAFAVAAAQVLPWAWCALLPAALSPLSSLLGAVSARQVGGWALLGLPLLVLALRRGRWFCHHLCPMGSVAELTGRLNPRRARSFRSVPHVGRGLAWLCIGGALAGYPLFLWLDPLAIFTGCMGAWRTPLTAESLLPATGFFLILLVSIPAPQVWCFRLCPLGATQDMLGIWGKRLRGRRPAHGRTLREPVQSHPAFTRRAFMAMAAGGVGGWSIRRALGSAGAQHPIRPPGAVDEALFTGLCARCGACGSVCPMRIVRPDLGQSGLAGLLTPVLDVNKSYCDEWCNACNKVCPSGAIRHVNLETKRATAVGRAVISTSRCIAWSQGKHCMVCQEFCPYLAVNIVVHDGVNCPEVDPEQCRGCGACQANCPALPHKAIVVHGRPQQPVRPMETES